VARNVDIPAAVEGSAAVIPHRVVLRRRGLSLSQQVARRRHHDPLNRLGQRSRFFRKRRSIEGIRVKAATADERQKRSAPS
jgi:hypothetical protein